jgi:Zn-finger nucleic acid-binding protein
MHLTCPNCGGMMRTNERSGVAAEQCVNCQWPFVGRVELEALLAVKAQFERAQAQEALDDAPLYEALASGAGYRADHQRGYRGEYGTDSSTDDRNERGRPNLRVVPSPPPDPPPSPFPIRDAAPVGLEPRDAELLPWYEQLEPVRQLRRGRHRR